MQTPGREKVTHAQEPRIECSNSRTTFPSPSCARICSPTVAARCLMAWSVTIVVIACASASALKWVYIWAFHERYLSFAIFLDLDRGCPTISVFLERDRHDLAFRRNIARDRDAPNAWQNQHVPCDRELTTPVHQARERLAFHRCFNGVTLLGRASFLMHTIAFRVSSWDGRLMPLFLCTSLQHGQLAGLSFSALALNAESSGQFLSIGALIAHDFLCVRLGNLDIGMPEAAGQLGDRCTGPDHAD